MAETAETADAALSFRSVPTLLPHAELEPRIRQLWRDQRVFERSIAERPADDVYSFYEGPPTANGAPGVHHVLSRVFKDLFPRYQTMRGKRVPRKGGWDTHGLPVELEVERALGLQSKSEIERYGIAEFNRQCRESVMSYVEQWEDMTERIAFWIDLDDAYRTYAPEYIESCWWILKRLWDAGLIYEARRTTPHCPRCETSLSSHEVAQGYEEDTVDPSVYIRFRARNQSLPPSLQWDGATDLLAWTTTPWTLPGNSGLAVAADAAYAVVRIADDQRLILAEQLLGAALKGFAEEYEIVARLSGAELVGVEYDGLYDPDQWGCPTYRFDGARLLEHRAEEGPLAARMVVTADFVSMDDGTGIVHTAPAFGEEDYVLGREAGLLFRQPVDLRGRMSGDATHPDAPGFVGMWVKDADEWIMRDLAERGSLWRRETVRHTYPFCWRCGTALLYYAKPSWYIATSRVQGSLEDSNEHLISWHPEHLRHGRYGDWLAHNVDWAVSRERYWGTPLPFWRCNDCGDTSCVGSFDELRGRAAGEADLSDPHRPYVDDIRVRCEQCGGEASRVPEVADAWFDSGAMPYAQWHYPFENQDRFEERFPADFICEAVDQTRGWFYSLHAEAVLLHQAEAVPVPTSFRHVLSLGHILDERGEKMSKSKGNVVDPWSVLDAHGADALRWYCYSAAPAGNPRRFSEPLVGEAKRRFIHTLWNTHSFFTTYANIDGWRPSDRTQTPQPSIDLDRWILSELHVLIGRVTSALDDYDATAASRALERFVDDLSNWYIRRSRRRFWSSARSGGDGADADGLAAKESAYATTYTVLTTLARLLAPLTPYLAEDIWQNLVAEQAERNGDAPLSVHLAPWPQVDERLIDVELNTEMTLVQRVASLGRAARSNAGIRVRQPLASVAVAPRSQTDTRIVERHRATIADELNVKRVELAQAAGESRRYTIKPNLRVLGPRLGAQLPALRSALASLTPELATAVAQAAEAGQSVEIEGVSLMASDLLIESQSGAESNGDAATASDDVCTVTLDTALDGALAREGLAREAAHRIQNLRRDSGLHPSDRIQLRLATADGELGAALADFESMIASETLARTVERSAEPPPSLPDDGWGREEAVIEGAALAIGLRRAESESGDSD